MSEDKLVLPKEIEELSRLTIENKNLEKMRVELIATVRTLIDPVALEWQGIVKLTKDLEEEANDHNWDFCDWPKDAIALIRCINRYRELKERETARYVEFVVNFVRELSVEDASKEIPAPINKEEILQKAEELLQQEPDMPLEFKDGERTLQGELNKEFGLDEDHLQMIEQIIKEMKDDRKPSGDSQ